MKELRIDIEHCYGIKKLQHVFDFEQHGDVVAIYAPNGSMKTSLAKTFQDLSRKEVSRDRIWPENETKRSIQDETGTELSPESVFVINPYDENYHSEKTALLLANDQLRKDYADVYSEIEVKEQVLAKALKPLTQLKDEVVLKELSTSITHNPKNLHQALGRLENEVKSGIDTPLGDVIYSDIFNPKTADILADADFMELIEEYIRTYDKLIEQSTFFRKGVFTHNNAADIAKNLQKNGFFQANHSIYINVGGTKKEIKSLDELEAAIQVEKDAILTDDELESAFELVNKKLEKNKDLKTFRDCLESNQILLTKMSNPNELRQQLWVAYLIRSRDAYSDLRATFAEGKQKIEEILEQAKAQETQWHEVINIFNNRFEVPFVVEIDNQEDVILERVRPEIRFVFKGTATGDDAIAQPVAEEKLLEILSNGEKRALYLLNIIFEVEARKTENPSTLFIADDIADSFDYKNKYAIIEYLQDISSQKNFQLMVLSHNFDFYRAISSRLDLQRESRFLVSKEGGELSLQQEKYQRSHPFVDWRKRINDTKILVALIPLCRNLAEFSGNDEVSDKLTSLLHVKPETGKISVGDLCSWVENMLPEVPDIGMDKEQIVKDLIYNEAEKIVASNSQGTTLEDKVVLSIAIRLKAEEFMVGEINDSTFWHGITRNQTVELIKKFKENFASERDVIKTLGKVNLMTPENIHMNSFMYEPILDLSSEHLKKLFSEVSAL